MSAIKPTVLGQASTLPTTVESMLAYLTMNGSRPLHHALRPALFDVETGTRLPGTSSAINKDVVESLVPALDELTADCVRGTDFGVVLAVSIHVCAAGKGDARCVFSSLPGATTDDAQLAINKRLGISSVEANAVTFDKENTAVRVCTYVLLPDNKYEQMSYQFITAKANNRAAMIQRWEQIGKAIGAGQVVANFSFSEAVTTAIAVINKPAAVLSVK